MRKRTKLISFIAVSALIAGACGNRADDEESDNTSAPATEAAPADTTDASGTEAQTDDTPTTDAPTTDAPTTTVGVSDPGVTDDTIKIGGSVTLSGPTGSIGEEVVGAATAYFDLVNGQGGINGRMIEFITYDDRADSGQYLANVKKLVEEDEVIALVTGFGDAGVEYISSQEIPTITFGVSPVTFQSKYPTIYPMVGNALLWTQETIAGLDDQGVIEEGMKVGIIYDDALIDIAPYVPAITESWENVGAEVVSADVMTLATGNCDPLVLKMKDLDVDYWDFQTSAWFLCVQAADRQGWEPNIGWGGWPASVPLTATVAGPLVEGVWAGSNGDQPTGAPRGFTDFTQEYIDAVTAYDPELAVPMRLESPAMLGYWSGAKLIVAGLEAQGDVVTKAGLNDWIQNVENFEVGVTPPVISMAPDCKTGSEVIWIAQWVWDETEEIATREAGPYFTSPQKDQFGGECFLTIISDEILG